MGADVMALIEEAIETGEVLSVIYHGGSQPGSKRMIAPIRVENDMVLARCLSAGTVRKFRVLGLEITDGESNAPAYVPGARIRAETVGELLEPYRSELLALGLPVTEERSRFGLHRYNNRGKPERHPGIAIEREDGCARPWRVRGEKLSRSFTDAGKALALFLSIARSSLVPSTR